MIRNPMRSMICSSLILVEYLEDGSVYACRLKYRLCGIYDKQPVICDTEMMYELYYMNTISEKQFIVNNFAFCMELAKKNKNESIQRRIEKLYETYL
jgi:Fe-S-cluster containining protein